MNSNHSRVYVLDWCEPLLSHCRKHDASNKARLSQPSHNLGFPEVSVNLTCLSSVHMHLTCAYYLNDTS